MKQHLSWILCAGIGLGIGQVSYGESEVAPGQKLLVEAQLRNDYFTGMSVSYKLQDAIELQAEMGSNRVIFASEYGTDISGLGVNGKWFQDHFYLVCGIASQTQKNNSSYSHSIARLQRDIMNLGLGARFWGGRGFIDLGFRYGVTLSHHEETPSEHRFEGKSFSGEASQDLGSIFVISFGTTVEQLVGQW